MHAVISQNIVHSFVRINERLVQKYIVSRKKLKRNFDSNYQADLGESKDLWIKKENFIFCANFQFLYKTVCCILC